MLDERKKWILQAIIDDYINTAEPIGSRTIARKHELNLSSATIRNEMADLEEMGYLAQPHTSAGRIPSDKGYRFYVDQLMKLQEVPWKEIEDIRMAMEVKINELNQLVKRASVVMSKATNYTSLVTTPQMKKTILKALQIVPIDAGKALVVMVTNEGIVKNTLVKISDSVSPDFIIRVSNSLNDKLSGLTLEQINMGLIKEIENEIGVSKEILIPILCEVADCISQIDNSEVLLDGTINILNYPEFRDVSKAKELLETLNEKEIINKLLRHNQIGTEINVKIGSENGVDEIRDCSLITSTYGYGDNVIGTIGIIGPTRMEYSRVVALMGHISKTINEEINKLINDTLKGI